jgi:hypothetical protein
MRRPSAATWAALADRALRASGPAAAVDHDGPELLEDRPDQRELLQVVAGHERQVLDIGEHHEAVAPAVVLGGDDEGALGQVLLALQLDLDAGEHAQRPDHPLAVEPQGEGDRLAAGQQGGEGGRQAVEDRQNPVVGVEQRAAHGSVSLKG